MYFKTKPFHCYLYKLGGALLPCLEHLIMLNTIFFDFLAGLGINVPNNEEMILICHACTKIHHSTEFR